MTTPVLTRQGDEASQHAADVFMVLATYPCAHGHPGPAWGCGDCLTAEVEKAIRVAEERGDKRGHERGFREGCAKGIEMTT